MKINYTVVGYTDFHEVYEEYKILPTLAREIKYIVNPPSLNIYYPILEHINTGYVLEDDFIDGTRIKSYKLHNLIVYEN